MINIKEAKEKLADIRFRYQHKIISREEAYKEAEKPLKIYNDKAIEIAKNINLSQKHYRTVYYFSKERNRYVI